MSRNFTSKELNRARRTELYCFLLSKHPEVIKRKGSTLILKEAHYVKVRKGYYGYIDYQSSERGNSIDFLTKYLGYRFDEAVEALLHI